jgi:opacity protein-like surface antigen
MVNVDGLEAFASFDYFFPGSSLTFWEVNVNGTYKLPMPQAPVAPYVGAGLNFAHISTPGVTIGGFGTVGGASSSYIGLNVLAGVRYPAGRVTAFGEVKFELRTGSQLVVTAGALF